MPASSAKAEAGFKKAFTRDCTHRVKARAKTEPSSLVPCCWPRTKGPACSEIGARAARRPALALLAFAAASWRDIRATATTALSTSATPSTVGGIARTSHMSFGWDWKLSSQSSSLTSPAFAAAAPPSPWARAGAGADGSASQSSSEDSMGICERIHGGCSMRCLS